MKAIERIEWENMQADALHRQREKARIEEAGEFTHELQDLVRLLSDAPMRSALETQALFMARRLLALKNGVAWSEVPCWPKVPR